MEGGQVQMTSDALRGVRTAVEVFRVVPPENYIQPRITILNMLNCLS
jgi:hypothetical protein